MGRLKWWEKTVEYRFVMALAKHRGFYLAPLDGEEERAGDAVLGRSDCWVLIEFKKDSDALGSERAKFAGGHYEQAKKALGTKDNHHHLVYGLEHPATPGHLHLSAETYFSGSRCNDLETLLNSGAALDEFKRYVEQYTRFKKGPKDDGGGGGSVDFSQLSLVAGVINDQNAVYSLSLKEFCLQAGLDLTPVMARPVRGIGGPRM